MFVFFGVGSFSVFFKILNLRDRKFFEGENYIGIIFVMIWYVSLFIFWGFSFLEGRGSF